MKDTQQDLHEIHLLEQNMQNINAQKQQFSAQLMEIESAIAELAKSSESYKIVGNIMVKKDSKEISADLKKKKEIIEIRIKTFEKQEEKLVEKMRKHQEEVLGKK